VLIDLRGENEKAVTVSNAIANVWNKETGGFASPEDLPKDKDAEIVFFCQGGGRAQKAKDLLTAQGYTNVHNGGGALNAKSVFG
jgi:rhodanese-related sulfurtransferase